MIKDVLFSNLFWHQKKIAQSDCDLSPYLTLMSAGPASREVHSDRLVHPGLTPTGLVRDLKEFEPINTPLLLFGGSPPAGEVSIFQPSTSQDMPRWPPTFYKISSDSQHATYVPIRMIFQLYLG